MNQNPKSNGLLNLPFQNPFSFFVLLISFFLFSSQSTFAQYQKTQKAVNAKIDSYVNGYYESLPVDYASSTTKKYPLLIFIHGVGEIGDGTSQLSLVLRHGPPKLLNAGTFPASFTVGGENFSFIVISPQLTDNNYTASPTIINDIINYCKQKYRVDEQRIYLTGLSMGGTMTWRFGGNSKTNADKIAASLVVCGGISNSSTTISNIGNSKLPVWATVNSGDPVMSATTTTAAIAAINAFVPTPPKALLSVFPVSGHDAWTKTYDPNFKQDGLNVYEWMLSYKRGTSSQPVPPIANAGLSQTITLPANSVTLDGSKSAASSGTITSYAWSKVSGSTATITSPASVKTTVTDMVAGTYQFKLTVKDSNGNSASATVSVTVNAAGAVTPLQSNAGANQTITLPTNSVIVDGSGKSTYPSGSTFLWVKKDGPAGGTIASPASLKTAITGLNTAGDYQFQLRITDKNGNVSASSMHVIVNPAPASTDITTLKSNAGANQTITLPTNSVTVDGSAKSTYPTGSTFLWVKKNGPAGGTIASATSLKTAITGLNTAGDYQFQLRITDKNGNVSASSMHVIVNPAPGSVSLTVLHSDAGSDQIITLPVSKVYLDGTQSTGPEGCTHIWKQSGGPVMAKILYPYSIKTDVTGLTVAGTYKFQLVITDTKGDVATSTVTITVNAAAGSAPLHADAGSNQTITLPVSKVYLDGTQSTGPEGCTHIWDQAVGPVTAKILYPYSIKTDVTGLTIAGTYKFRLLITDAQGNAVSSYVTITVESAVSGRTMAGSDENIRQDQSLQVVGPDISSASAELEVKVNPNPVQSDMTIRINGKPKGKTSVTIYSLSGQILLQQEFVKDASGAVSKTFNISKLAPGTYIGQIIVDNKYKKTIKILKQ
ncbi:PKD domain-containing protein [Agriterribacter sp.]|uniref:PKD domain-containing protein n=1 Tax=Agriterribacter sp. TaxID=2821509 RepID=UPI002B5F40EA|nr:PKD domain-containing protein [Agriterribacter sp.]HTN05783.1 PKD domain-containing protein [Agriterribacter sp.]